MNENSDYSLDCQQLDLNHLDLFNEDFLNQEEKMFVTEESIEAFNVRENALFGLFGLKEEKILFDLNKSNNDLSSQINSSAEEKIKSRFYQKIYRDKIKEAKETFVAYDPDFFKRWRKEIPQLVSLDIHVKKIMIHNKEKFDHDYPHGYERFTIKNHLVSFCKDVKARKNRQLKKCL